MGLILIVLLLLLLLGGGGYGFARGNVGMGGGCVGLLFLVLVVWLVLHIL